ncbi:MAG: polymerase subunit alpha [Firmicutes bacterium]|nr:polymerase subunit alpha [Bacillota bacterium]
MVKWVSLHNHTGYSLLDGSAKIKDLISRTKELGMDSIAITDHGVMFGCVEFFKEAAAQGVKPIIGCEVYVAAKSMDIKQNSGENETHHLVLLVKDEKGYSNLMKIVSEASISGFYYKPRTDKEFLRKHSEGLIALSACLGGEIPSLILQDNVKKAESVALEYSAIFGGEFYLELQYHGMEEQLKVNRELVEMSGRLGMPLVATNDTHYINKEDSVSHDVLLCIQTAKNVNDEDRMRYPSEQFYLRSPEEMHEIFSYVPEALENTVKIAEKCNYSYEFHKSKLPRYPLEPGTDPFGYLRDLCYEGMGRKYPAITSELEERLEYELRIINQMGYVDYFLIVWDFIKFADDNGIMTGPGRGSAAGSLVAYALNITKIDPIKYSLIFERFLNPDRISMPDIDSDFCYERRQEVIDYVVDKYGVDNVSQIVTFGTMAARACIRDVGRALDYSYAEVDRIAKMIPQMLGITIEKALQVNSELKQLYDEDERCQYLIDIAKRLEGLPRHTSTHAAGVVIASEPLVNFVPLQKNEDSIVTQFTMGSLEELGLLKMDFLGLRTLTVIRDAVEMIEKNEGVRIDIGSLDLDDREVYRMIGEGHTVGVFQLESAGMTSFMKELKPDSLEDIIAGISLYRPGPMAEIPKYIRNKKDPECIKYETDELKPILGVTYGCMVYQEQVMQIVRDLAGYSMGRSDLVRRAMSKKKHEVMEQERKSFVEGCQKRGINPEAADRIFDSMMDFASYAFNKSHAAAYAVVGYQTAYLMCYYPAEFLAAMLNSVMGDSTKVAYYIRYAEEKGIQILPPDINESIDKFAVTGNRIRFGLSAVKNVGVNVIRSIVKSREEKGRFTDLEDFCSKIDIACINKRVVESLIKAGAFDCFGVYRSQLLDVYEKVLDGISSERKRNIEGQMSLFAGVQDSKIKIRYPDIREFDKKHLLAMEKEMTGLYLTGHPLDQYERALRNQTSIKISDIVSVEVLEDDDSLQADSGVKDGDMVIIGGIITEVSRKITRNNANMAFVKIEDLFSVIEVVVFPKTYEKCKSLIEEDGIVLVKGRVSIKEDEKPKLLCESLDPLLLLESEKLYVQIEEDSMLKDELLRLKQILLEHKGNVPVYLFTKKERKKYRLDREFWVENSPELMSELRSRFGEGNVKLA